MPFLLVQIAPFRATLPELREAQLLTWKKAPITAMAVTDDVGDAINIHLTWYRWLRLVRLICCLKQSVNVNNWHSMAKNRHSPAGWFMVEDDSPIHQIPPEVSRNIRRIVHLEQIPEQQ